MFECGTCGQDTEFCICDQEAEGYECGKCGYTPTYRELHRGTCVQCRTVEREKDNVRDSNSDSMDT